MEITIPCSSSIIKEYSQLELPDKDDYDYYIARQNRVFYLEGMIYRDQDTDYSPVAQLIKTIININLEDVGKPVKERKPIVIMEDSVGGDLDIAFALADVIKNSVTPCYTVALASVMSAAFIIYISGHKRFTFPHSQILCHQGSITIGGNAAEAQEAMKNYKDTLAKMKEYILSNTKIDAKVFSKNQKKDWYISPAESVTYGISDKIITSLSDIFDCQ